MKTHDEIKKGLECYVFEACMDADCDKCSRNIYTPAEVYDNEPIRDALALIKQLEAERDAAVAASPRWISVEERLPKHGQIVFCYTRYFYEVLQWDDDSEQWFGKYSVNAKHYVTHWMPLPQPPKEETK